MFQLDLKSRKSIYEQIIDKMKELIVTGVLPPEEKIPSVRELAGMLTVNPNTIQKAYRELEQQGYVYTASGLGSFVAPPESRKLDSGRLSEITDRLRDDLRDLTYLGLTFSEIRSLTGQLLDRQEAEWNAADHSSQKGVR